MDSGQYIKALEQSGRKRYLEYASMRVSVPVGRSGPWEVRRFETEIGLAYLRLARDGRPSGLGEFTALSHDRRGIVMSDTCPEIDDLKSSLAALRGNILVTGLGLGMTLHILTKVSRYAKHVVSITVVEKEEDVIRLTGDHYRDSDKRITIHHADALEWTPPGGCFYDAAWHDIWDKISEDNRPQMTAIRRHYQRHVAKGQQFCWGEIGMERGSRRGF